MKKGFLNQLLHDLALALQLEIKEQPSPADEKLAFIKTVETARREWLQAKEYFRFVSDPDLVDHAIHAIDAAEKKYMYLLRKAREEGITAAIPVVEYQSKEA